MHVAIFVYFKAAQGGLHDNVFDAAKWLVSSGCDVTVVCKPGQFADRLSGVGVSVVNCDFTHVSGFHTLQTLGEVHLSKPIDVVHAHPFASRRLAHWFAKSNGLPFLVTFHGKYSDGLESYVDDVNAVLCVSEGVKQYLLGEIDAKSAEKFFVAPNVPDTSGFFPLEERTSSGDKPFVISLVSRFDKDKQFIIDIFYEALAYTARLYPGKVEWRLVGGGSQMKEVEYLSSKISGDKGTVECRGWKIGEELRQAYVESTLVIAPGRCVLESLSCGVPTIAVGSKGYVGLISPQCWKLGVYSNFGGIGSQYEGYERGSVERDIDSVLSSSLRQQELKEFGPRVINRFYDAEKTHRGYMDLLTFAELEGPLSKVVENDRVPLEFCVERVDVQVSGAEVSIGVTCVESTDAKYAWYIYRNGSLLEKVKYSSVSEFSYKADVEGTYIFRCFIRDDISKINFVAAERVLPEGSHQLV